MRYDETTIAFTGDIGFDKYMDRKWEDDSFLSDEISDFLCGADHVVANVEGAVFDPGKISGSSVFIHTMDPAVVTALKKMNADIWNICNNHIMDAGEAGVRSTLDIAKENGCLTLGAGFDENEASKPVVIKEAGGIGIISVGYQIGCEPAGPDKAGCFRWDDMERIAARIAEVKKSCRWCVVVVHGGEEFAPLPLPYTRDRYVKYLEMGADVVVGHHPHVVENYELFDDGKMIFYSLGNFIFDTDYQRSQLYTEFGVLLKLKFTKDKMDFVALGIKIDRERGKVRKVELPEIFTNVSANEFELLAPLGVKAFLSCETRKIVYLNPAKFRDDPNAAQNIDRYFSKTHKYCVKGEHMDFDLLLTQAKEAEKMTWQKSTLERVKAYLLTLI